MTLACEVTESGKQAPCAQFRMLRTLDEMDCIKDELWSCSSKTQIPVVHSRHKGTKAALKDLLAASKSAMTRLDTAVKKFKDANKRKADVLAGRSSVSSSAAKRAKRDAGSAHTLAGEISVVVEVNAQTCAKPALVRFDAKRLDSVAEECTPPCQNQINHVGLLKSCLRSSFCNGNTKLWGALVGCEVCFKLLCE